MNLYHKKQRWKITLMGLAVILVSASLWFSYQIVQKVQNKELDRVEQWAESVKRKSELVNLTNRTFEELSTALIQLKQRDSAKVDVWARAMGEINKNLVDYSFTVHVLQTMSGIPVIITDAEENMVSTHNFNDFDKDLRNHVDDSYSDQSESERDSLYKEMRNDSMGYFIQRWAQEHPPLELSLYKNEIQKVFYFDSIYFKTQKLYTLERSRDSLLDAFNEELINNEYLVPVMFLDKKTRKVLGTNMPEYDSTNSSALISKLESENDSIVVDLGSEKGVIYYEHSPELTQMKYFPVALLLIISLFIFIAYLGFSTFRKAEQDQVWVGMAKETAHQLGTPISSLMAWNQLLEGQGVDREITKEIDTDIDRLTKVTNRFSKIGSDAMLTEGNVVEVLEESIAYLRKRISDKVSLELKTEEKEVLAPINVSLLEWVVENITKNAVDAMESKGSIEIELRRKEDSIIVDITDDGKGIPANKMKQVFQPGFTTKKRGWGLGLTLVKRIVEDFHKGKVFVHKSEVGVGTTFRIILQA